MKGNYFMLLCLLANILNALCQRPVPKSTNEVDSPLKLNSVDLDINTGTWNAVNDISFGATVVANIFQRYIKMDEMYPVVNRSSSNATNQPYPFFIMEATAIHDYITSAMSNNIADYHRLKTLGINYARNRTPQNLQYWIILQEEIMKHLRLRLGIRFSLDVETAWIKMMSKMWEPIFNGYYEQVIRDSQSYL